MLHWVLCCSGGVYMLLRAVEYTAQLILALKLCNSKTWPSLRATIALDAMWAVVCSSVSVALFLEILL